jgi:8-oxo-dGTP pyrophosphatase MutT (NUDIX family)
MDLSEDFIIDKLKAAYRPGVIASMDGFEEMYRGAELQCAAVLVPLVRREGEWHVLYTRRTQTVEHHKGQVSFPGGRCDAGEEAAELTALREAREEIGMQPSAVRLLGRLNDVLTITRYRVTPVVGVIPAGYEFRLERAEVERAFTIPLLWMARSENWEEVPLTPGGEVRPFPVITYHPYDGEVLWGASARMTQNFLQVLGLIH